MTHHLSPDPTLPRLLTPEEAAERLKVSLPTIRSWIQSGILAHTRIGPGRLIRIREEDLLVFINQNYQEAQTEPAREEEH